jgi:cytochrome b561
MQMSSRYSRVAVALHWLMAVLMFGNILLAWSIDLVPEERIRQVIDTHKSIGITVLGLLVLRVLWRLGHKPPAWPEGFLTLWEGRVAHLVHIGLYALLFALPFSGWLHDSAWKAADTHPMTLFGLVPWPRISAITSLEPVQKEALHDLFGEAHEALATVFYVLFALHLLGALKHQFIDGRKGLQRMWF